MKRKKMLNSRQEKNIKDALMVLASVAAIAFCVAVYKLNKNIDITDNSIRKELPSVENKLDRSRLVESTTPYGEAEPDTTDWKILKESTSAKPEADEKTAPPVGNE